MVDTLAYLTTDLQHLPSPVVPLTFAQPVHPFTTTQGTRHRVEGLAAECNLEYVRKRLHRTRLLRGGSLSPHAALLLAHGSRAAPAGPWP